MCVRVYVCVRACVRACVNAYVRTYVRTFMRACVWFFLGGREGGNTPYARTQGELCRLKFENIDLRVRSDSNPRPHEY